MSNNRFAWATVRFIQQADVAVRIPDDLPAEQVPSYVEREIMARNPEDRIKSAQMLTWEVECKGAA